MVDEYAQPNVTEKDFERGDFISWFEAECDRVTQHNAAVYERHRQAYTELIGLAIKVYGVKSPEYRYLAGRGIKSPENLARYKRNVLRRYNKWLREADKTLRELGYVPNEDYRPSSAITFLKRVNGVPKAEYTERMEAVEA